MTGELEFHRVTRRYRRGTSLRSSTWVEAVSDLSFVLGPADTLGIIGPNGAGKTTLLRLAAGITLPEHGWIRRRGRVAAVIELGTGFHRDLTGAENIGFAGAVLGMSRREIIARREAIVEFSGLASDIHRPVKHYSTGMLARLAFAIAVHAEPDLLLLDEVLAVGDLEYQQRCYEQIARLQSAGTSIVLVSHHLSLINAFCGRTLLIDAGRMVACGPTEGVVASYLGAAVDVEDLAAPVSLEIQSIEQSIETDDPIDLLIDLAVHRPLDGARARLELAHPAHPGGAVDEMLRGQIVFASCDVELPLARPGEWVVEVRVFVPALVPGRYLVSVVVEGDDGEAQHRASSNLMVKGVPSLTPSATLAAGWQIEADRHSGGEAER